MGKPRVYWCKGLKLIGVEVFIRADSMGNTILQCWDCDADRDGNVDLIEQKQEGQVQFMWLRNQKEVFNAAKLEAVMDC